MAYEETEHHRVAKAFLNNPAGMMRELLGDAEALLNPIRWPEPFGLVMIEALACGTPVLSFAEVEDDRGTLRVARPAPAAARSPGSAVPR